MEEDTSENLNQVYTGLESRITYTGEQMRRNTDQALKELHCLGAPNSILCKRSNDPASCKRTECSSIFIRHIRTTLEWRRGGLLIRALKLTEPKFKHNPISRV